MKKIFSAALVLVICYSAIAQSSPNGDFIDINNVKARLNPAGDLFWNYSNAQFEVPKGSGKHTMFAANLWIGGIDIGGQLRVAGQTYRQSGNDFYYGPFPGSSQSAQWNRVWKINKSMVDSFRLGLYQTIPQVILDWPGNGNTSLGQAQNLAPYKDVNGNNIYEPQNGEPPCIRGDQSVYFIFNDDNIHTETGGQQFGIEVHGMAYAFDRPSDTALNHTVFIKYRVINYSTFQNDNVYIGLWSDPDLGNYSDDYVGCDVERSAYYVYNGDNNDEISFGGYGKFPPAQAVLFANAGPQAVINDGIDNNHNCIVDEPGEKWVMSDFTYYDNSGGSTGNPIGAMHYYNYLKSVWGDTTHVTYGGSGYNTGGLNCSYMFPGTSDQQYGWGTGGNCIIPNVQQPWDEISAGNIPADRRGVGSYGPFTLMPGAELCLDFAFVWARTSDTVNDPVSISALQKAIDSVQTFFDVTPLFGCDCVLPPLGITENSSINNPINIFPNPSSDFISVTCQSKTKNPQFEIIDVTGRKISSTEQNQIDVSKLPQGLYLLKITDGELSFSKRFVKN